MTADVFVVLVRLHVLTGDIAMPGLGNYGVPGDGYQARIERVGGRGWSA